RYGTRHRGHPSGPLVRSVVVSLHSVSRCQHVVEDRSPTLRRRELANQLRDLRKQSGRTVEDVAQALLCSPPKISRIETGARSASLRDVRDLCVLYGVDDTLRERLMDVAREAKEPGWWSGYGE